jgi:hypothetical protein
MFPSGSGPAGRQNLGLENCLGLADNRRRIFTIDEDLLRKFDRILLT